MNVFSVSIVGITIVFLCFCFLYVVFKILEKLFSKKTVAIQTSVAPIRLPSSIAPAVINDFEEEETIAVISAAIFAFSKKPFQIKSIVPVISENQQFRRAQRYKTWKPRCRE